MRDFSRSRLISNNYKSRPFITVLLIIFHSVGNYEVGKFLFYFLILVLFSNTVIIFFLRLLKRPVAFLTIYSGQHLALSCPDCTHPDSVISDAQKCTYKQWALRAKYIWGFSCLLFVWNFPVSIMNIIGNPHLDSTTELGVLVVQNIPNSFLSERICTKTFNQRCWSAYGFATV